MSDCSSIDPLVTRYVDGELPPADHRAVDEHSRACPPCRARIVVELAVRDLMRARQSALQSERASDRLRAQCAAQCLHSIPEAPRVRGSAARVANRRPLAPLALAAALLLVVAGASIFQLTKSSTRVMAAELAADHVKCFLLQDLIGAEAPTASVERALIVKFGWPIRFEKPNRAGLDLVGERTCMYGLGRVAHILYRHQGRPVSVFMLPKDARKDEIVDTLGYSSAVWSEGERTFVLIARESRSDFERMAGFLRAGFH